MGVIKKPLSPGGGWREVSLYRTYIDLAKENLDKGSYFEAVAICCIGLDVLLNALPDRILLFSLSKLDDCQKRILEEIEDRTLTAGALLKQLETACVLDRRFLRALNGLNADRNKIFHPFQRRKLKSGAILPSSATKDAADKFYRKFCHVIDLAAGRSPLREERELNRYIEERKRTLKKHFSKP